LVAVLRGIGAIDCILRKTQVLWFCRFQAGALPPLPTRTRVRSLLYVATRRARGFSFIT